MIYVCYITYKPIVMVQVTKIGFSGILRVLGLRQVVQGISSSGPLVHSTLKNNQNCQKFGKNALNYQTPEPEFPHTRSVTTIYYTR